MKEDKICLSKTVAFVAVVAFILVGVVVFTNYVNNQKLSSDTKAEDVVGTLLDVADRKITCPLPGSGVVASAWRQGTEGAYTYYKNTGVCAGCAIFEKSKGLATCQKCCNEPATEAEYLVSHPNPGDIDCTVDDATTNRKAGYYYKSFDGLTCYGIGTKAVESGSPNQYCRNETLTDVANWPQKCNDAAPTPMVCSGTYTFSGDGQKCVGYKTLLVGSGTENQYCANEANATLANCGAAPTPLPCATSGTYTLSGNGNTCSGVKTEIFRSGTVNQYCGNKIYTKIPGDSWPAGSGCGNVVPAAMMCPPTGTKVYLTGDACYLKEGKLVDGGTGNQRCDNLKLTAWTCCNDATTAGCQ